VRFLLFAGRRGAVREAPRKRRGKASGDDIQNGRSHC
jgi:hypothetical protein